MPLLPTGIAGQHGVPADRAAAKAAAKIGRRFPDA